MSVDVVILSVSGRSTSVCGFCRIPNNEMMIRMSNGVARYRATVKGLHIVGYSVPCVLDAWDGIPLKEIEYLIHL